MMGTLRERHLQTCQGLGIGHYPYIGAR